MSIPLPTRLLLPLTTPTKTPSFPYYYYSSFLSSPNPRFTFSSYSHYSCNFRRNPHSFSQQKWLCGHTRRDQETDGHRYEEENAMSLFSSDEETGTQIPTQAQSIVEGSGTVMVSELKPVPDIDYLQELLAIQQQGPRAIGFFGTRNMGFMHQELVEILSYALVITKNHIYTSGASGTNAAVIRGALRAEKPDLLTVILPQSLKKQPPESQELLEKETVMYQGFTCCTTNVECGLWPQIISEIVATMLQAREPVIVMKSFDAFFAVRSLNIVKTVIEKPYNDHLPLIEASRLCNRDIISHVQQVICFAFHDSKLLMETCQEAKSLRKIVTLFYLD